MAKFIACLFVLLFGLVGCGGSPEGAISVAATGGSSSVVDPDATVDPVVDADVPVESDAGSDAGSLIVCVGDQCPCTTDTSWGVMRCYEQSRVETKVEYKCVVKAVDCSPVTSLGDSEFCLKETALRQACECTPLNCGQIAQCWCNVSEADAGNPEAH
jgi:hypothetical protein